MTKILVTGATGYIGGSILSQLLADVELFPPSCQPVQFSVLIRNKKAEEIFASKGITSYFFDGLDDLEAIRKASSEHDVVINTASASDFAAARAIVEGLALRKASTGKTPLLLHTSGTSILGDQVEGRESTERTFSDLHDDIYGFEATHPIAYGQRLTDVVVVDSGLEHGVDTLIVVPPTIYGQGSGFFATISQQVPYLTRLAIREKRVHSVNSGKSIWNHVHVDDMTRFYSLLLRKEFEGDERVEKGKKGYYFVQSGEHTWSEVASNIAKSLDKRGLVETQEIREIGAKEMAEKLKPVPLLLVQLGFSSNARARDDRARALGWSPSRSSADFYAHFDDVAETVSKEFA